MSNRSCSSRLPLWYTPRIVARFLVEVQESGAEEEERRDDEARDERRDRQRLVARAAQEEEQAALGEEDEDRERRQRPERMDEVRAGEPVGAQEREPEPHLLEREHRDDQTESGQPREPGQDEEGDEERKRQEDEQSSDERLPLTKVRFLPPLKSL